MYSLLVLDDDGETIVDHELALLLEADVAAAIETAPLTRQQEVPPDLQRQCARYATCGTSTVSKSSPRKFRALGAGRSTKLRSTSISSKQLLAWTGSADSTSGVFFDALCGMPLATAFGARPAHVVFLRAVGSSETYDCLAEHCQQPADDLGTRGRFSRDCFRTPMDRL